jgi:hypothetical protein
VRGAASLKHIWHQTKSRLPVKEKVLDFRAASVKGLAINAVKK